MSTILQLEALSKRYPKRNGREWVTAVDNVSINVKTGEIVGLLGPNGAGKTTTIKMTCGLIIPDSGRIMIGGHDLSRERRRCLQQIAAVLEGNRNLYWRLTARENLAYFAGNRGRGGPGVKREIEELLERFRLLDKGNELVSNLSRGMQQKLAIAVAFLADSELILLDEPTLGLDVETGYEIRELLREIAAAGRTIIISTHDMPVVQDLCERTIIINEGRVIADDRVDNLLRLFATRAYAVTLTEPLGSGLAAQLQAEFPQLTISDNRREFTVSLEQAEDIYRLMALLESQQTPLEAIDRRTINFEQVFRELISSGTNGAKNPEGVTHAA
jgi:ABC-2 type transport system ATP-binding protein